MFGNNFMRQLQRSVGKNYGVRPRIQTLTSSPTVTPGFDMGSRAAGLTSRPSGIPHKAMHRRYFGIKPPGT